MLKILFFSRNKQLFQKSTGINILYDRVRKLFYILAGEALRGIGETLSAKSPTGEASRVHLTGQLDRVCNSCLKISLPYFSE